VDKVEPIDDPSIDDLLKESVPERPLPSPGDPIITEVGRSAFIAAYIKSRSDERHTTKDKRPAIRTGNSFGYEIWTVPNEIAWDIMKSAAGSKPVMSYEHQCRTCGSAMKMTREFGDTWAFHCQNCKTVHVQGKDKVGGTHGAGEKEPV